MWKFIWIAALVLPAVLSTTEVDNRKRKGNIWAVLVAGSNGFGQYRHQADVCHSYQILHRHRIPDSHIIVMMYDDIANNSANPFKGVIINKPGGPNVYKNVPKDYTGDNVTPDNFLHVLTGNKMALEGNGSGKVLKSGPRDHVFVFFAGIGAEGIIGFPNNELHAADLIKALKTMHKKKMYKKLVFYMDSCESGSMFEDILPQKLNIFATTSANSSECSSACYFDRTLYTYLGDEYSCSWTEDTDAKDNKGTLRRETLFGQYRAVTSRVSHSLPQMYGKMNLKKDHLKDYIGMGKTKNDSMDKIELKPFQDSVPSRDVPIYIIQNKIQMAENVQEKKLLEMKLADIIKGRATIDGLFKSIMSYVTTRTDGDLTAVENEHQPLLTQEARRCYKIAVESFRQNCISFKNTYAMAHLYKLANLCVKEYSPYKILQAFTSKCDENHRSLTGVY